MDENARKKREWVKTAAIIFLSVMLVLTFFSNTIMNYSLPEAAIQYIQSGTVTAKVRGSGVVESGDPYNIEVTETRKVASVAVHEGDFVEQGDIILYLEDQESEELAAAQEALDQAWDAYEDTLLSSEVPAQSVQASQGTLSAASYRQRLNSAQKAVKDAQKRVDDLTKQLNELSRQQAVSSNGDGEQRELEEWAANAAAEAAYAEASLQEATDAKTQLIAMGGTTDEAYNAKLYAERILSLRSIDDEALGLLESFDTETAGLWERNLAYYSFLACVSGNDPGEIQDAWKQIETLANQDHLGGYSGKLIQAEAAEYAAQSDLNAKKTEAARAQAALTRKTSAGTLSQKDLTAQIADVTAQQAIARADLEEKQTALTELTTTITGAFGLEREMEAVDKAQEKVDELTEKSIGATVTADISGTVTAVNVTAGGTISADTPVAVLQPEGKGFTLSFSVTNEQAKRLAVGDRADLVNAWRYDDVEVTLSGIKPDPDDPGQKKLLTFEVSGNVTAGQTLNLSVGQKSANYDYIVPNSSIREDNNGKFILVVTAKPGPLSTRYIATRVDVEVLASDDSQSAVSSGMLTGYDPVITTATKPVEAGMQVRLSDN